MTVQETRGRLRTTLCPLLHVRLTVWVPLFGPNDPNGGRGLIMPCTMPGAGARHLASNTRGTVHPRQRHHSATSRPSVWITPNSGLGSWLVCSGLVMCTHAWVRGVTNWHPRVAPAGAGSGGACVHMCNEPPLSVHRWHVVYVLAWTDAPSISARRWLWCMS